MAPPDQPCRLVYVRTRTRTAPPPIPQPAPPHLQVRARTSKGGKNLDPAERRARRFVVLEGFGLTLFSDEFCEHSFTFSPLGKLKVYQWAMRTVSNHARLPDGAGLPALSFLVFLRLIDQTIGLCNMDVKANDRWSHVDADQARCRSLPKPHPRRHWRGTLKRFLEGEPGYVGPLDMSRRQLQYELSRLATIGMIHRDRWGQINQLSVNLAWHP